MNRISILAAAIAGLTAPVGATEWVPLSGGGNDQVWIDTDRPRWVGRQVTFWMAIGLGLAEPEGTAQSLSLVTIECENRTYSLRNHLRYDGLGNEVTAGPPFSRGRVSIAEESHVGRAFQYLCFAQSE